MVFKKNLFIKLTFLFVVVTSNASAQFNYTITYEYLDKDGISLESKLIIKGNESVFKILDNRSSGKIDSEDGSPSYYVINDELSTFIYADDEYSYVRIPYPETRKGTAYSIKKEPLNWKLTGNAKKIGDYNCQEATLELKGRIYNVWFTPHIPITFGPLKLDGLPGLIVQVKEKSSYCSLNLIDVKRKMDNELFQDSKSFFNKEQVITFKDYEKFMKKFIIESKIIKAQKLAQMKKLYNLSENDLSINLEKGEYHFVRMLIDIPAGTIEELKKINF